MQRYICHSSAVKLARETLFLLNVLKYFAFAWFFDMCNFKPTIWPLFPCSLWCSSFLMCKMYIHLYKRIWFFQFLRFAFKWMNFWLFVLNIFLDILPSCGFSAVRIWSSCWKASLACLRIIELLILLSEQLWRCHFDLSTKIFCIISICMVCYLCTPIKHSYIQEPICLA